MMMYDKHEQNEEHSDIHLKAKLQVDEVEEEDQVEYFDLEFVN